MKIKFQPTQYQREKSKKNQLENATKKQLKLT